MKYTITPDQLVMIESLARRAVAIESGIDAIAEEETGSLALGFKLGYLWQQTGDLHSSLQGLVASIEKQATDE